MDGGGADDQLAFLHVFRQMGIGDLCSELPELFGNRGLGAVGAGNLRAQMEQQLRQRGHRNAADADQMNFSAVQIRL